MNAWTPGRRGYGDVPRIRALAGALGALVSSSAWSPVHALGRRNPYPQWVPCVKPAAPFEVGAATITSARRHG
jgi:hypothetical protein